MFRKNQYAALAASKANGYSSGVHYHATGTGKSWIALQLALDFCTNHKSLQPSAPSSHILWICEQKSILVEQFAKEVLKDRGFAAIQKTFLILDYSSIKAADWAQQVNSAQIWRKPMLVVINRAFLTSSLKYQTLRIPFGLLIHDECHSITNASTQAFYTWLKTASPVTRCIGFSATPTFTHAPYTSLLSSYTIYDAAKDGVIVPPRIVWLKKEEGHVGNADVRRILQLALPTLPYKKVIVWCGMIETAHQLTAEWSADPAFKDWMFAIDTTGEASDSKKTLATYTDFQALQERGFLFCANKHREGSDIPRLDACIFLDRVAKRNAKTFLQCMGRVLRRDPAGLKTHGLVLDLCAASSLTVCDRIHQYINPTQSNTTFPFQYSFRRFQDIQVHLLEMQGHTERQGEGQVEGQGQGQTALPIYDSESVQTLFIRSLPKDPQYKKRLDAELALFQEKDLFGYVRQALEILKITKDIPHVTRGSCGSSLVCYMLGISHVDPIKWDIKFARFLNEFRDTLPDIDFDFPHTMRDEVFLQIQMRWPGQVARISNHVYYHKKSAVREAVRRVGIHKMIPALQMTDTIRRLPLKQQANIQATTKSLENTFKCYSLHCGGIVFYPDGVPKALKLSGKRGTLSQVTLNKQDIAKERRFKIDILSSRALSQLAEARRLAGITTPIDFEAFVTDSKTAELFRRGDNIGITLAESPLMRKAFRKIQPATLEDVALCLAIIRPAAREARVATTEADLTAMFVYDDDAITLIANALQCTDAEADRIRRGFAKGDKATIQSLKKALQQNKQSDSPNGIDILAQLKNLRQYSFCKSHAFSYAQLVWQLGYMKAHYPTAFWQATLKHNESSYRKWVHAYEARCAGIETTTTQKHVSIYAENRRRAAKVKAEDASPEDQVRGVGMWANTTTDTINSFFPECYHKPSGTKTTLRGLIASSRVLNWHSNVKKAVLFVGVGPQEYVEVVLEAPRIFLTKKIGITCEADKQGDVWIVKDKSFALW